MNDNQDCVELGIWTPIPVPPSTSLALHLKDIDSDASRAIKSTGVMSFHAVGCTGCRHTQETTAQVAKAMAVQVDHPHQFGGTSAAVAASFLYHLGDVVYKHDKDDLEQPPEAVELESDTEKIDLGQFYNSQFYEPYKNYSQPIFAVAGNHDGKQKTDDKPAKSEIRHFLKNFCGINNDSSPDNTSSHRLPMKQPYPYWLLKTPLASVIGLYSNVCNAGQLDDPASNSQPQFDWLVQTLTSIKAEADGKAVFLAVHYPPYSAAANFFQRGNPNLSPSAPKHRTLEPIGILLQKAFVLSGQYPDAVFSAHAHHYQRLTYTSGDGRQIPYLIAGAGGHDPIEKLAKPCSKSNADSTTFDGRHALVLPDGLTLPAGDKIELTSFNEQDFGFLRLTLDSNKQILTGEYFAASTGNALGRSLPALDDSFNLDLRAHKLR